MTVAPEPGINEIITSLEGLPLEVFFEESFTQLTLRSPQIVTEAGVAALLGVRNNELDNLSDAYIRETQKLEVATLDLLRTYDREALSDEDKTAILKVHQKMMILIRKALLISIENKEEDIAGFISEIYEQWEGFKPTMKKVAKDLIKNWEEERFEDRTTLGYMG